MAGCIANGLLVAVDAGPARGAPPVVVPLEDIADVILNQNKGSNPSCVRVKYEWTCSGGRLIVLLPLQGHQEAQ